MAASTTLGCRNNAKAPLDVFNSSTFSNRSPLPPTLCTVARAHPCLSVAQRFPRQRGAPHGGLPHLAPSSATEARGPTQRFNALVSAASSTALDGPRADPAPAEGLLYEHVVFDMDGTLTVSTIDFKRMRERTGILEGDLFTVMDSWGDPERVTEAHNTILEMEAEACASLRLQPGLEDLLAGLSERGAKVGLVTRNTTVSVDAFFAAVGEHWRGLFSIILTREFRFVKPDKRLLLHVADQWGVDPSALLMVGDSREDVECGNAAGTATCLISGGGNELTSAATPSAATYDVSSLSELKDILLRVTNKPPSGFNGKLSSGELAQVPAQVVSRKDVTVSAGLRFADSLLAAGIIRAAFCSYPRLAGAFGGAMASTREGDRVLHLGCGDGSLTKLLASQGMTVEGVDEDPDLVAAAASRGLVVRHAADVEPLITGTGRQLPVNVVIAFTCAPAVESSAAEDIGGIGPPFWATSGYATSIWQALTMGGHFAAGHVILNPPGTLRLADATIALDLSAQPFFDRGFIVSRQTVERWPEGIFVSLVLTKPGMASFKS